MFSWLWGSKPIRALNVLHAGNKYVLRIEPHEKDLTLGALKHKLGPLLDVPAEALQVYQTSPKRKLSNDGSTLAKYGLKDGETLLVVGDKPKPRTASEQIAACVAGVEEELGARIAAFSRSPPADADARNKEFMVLNEVVLQNILKLDGIEAEGEDRARVRQERKDAINKLQRYHHEIDVANRRENGGPKETETEPKETEPKETEPKETELKETAEPTEPKKEKPQKPKKKKSNKRK